MEGSLARGEGGGVGVVGGGGGRGEGVIWIVSYGVVEEGYALIISSRWHRQSEQVPLMRVATGCRIVTCGGQMGIRAASHQPPTFTL